MSYILDALKKIEHEKNRKNRPDGMISISGALFQERNQTPARAGIRKLLLLIAVVALVTCAGTWFVLRGTGRQGAVIARPSVPKPAAPVKPPVETPAVPALAPQQPAPVVLPEAVPVVQKNAVTDADNDSPAREVRHSKSRVKPQPPAPKQPDQTVQAPADIKLSGVAWQDDRSARRAVVNGFLLKEGAVVSGATITDIQADRVRFSSAAGPFEIKLDSVLPAGVQR
jgi:general secretion pathway protein B